MKAKQNMEEFGARSLDRAEATGLTLMKSKAARRSRVAPGDQGSVTTVPLRFIEFTEPKAKTVCVVGTFNGWRPDVSSLTCLGDGCWVNELHLSPGRYEYRLIVDGEWIPDLFAEEHAPNPFGGINSVLTVSARPPVELGKRVNREQRSWLQDFRAAGHKGDS